MTNANISLPFSFSKINRKLITLEQLRVLYQNYIINEQNIQSDGNVEDFKPVVRLFTLNARMSWLLTELNPELVAFGLCDLGMGEPELGYVSLLEIMEESIFIQSDQLFKATMSLSCYAEQARERGKITV